MSVQLTPNKANVYIAVVGTPPEAADCGPLLETLDWIYRTPAILSITEADVASIGSIASTIATRTECREVVGSRLAKVLGVDIDKVAFVVANSDAPEWAIEFVRMLDQLYVSTGIILVTDPRYGTTCVGGSIHQPSH